MSDTDYHSTVGDALAILIDGLSPFVERVFGEILPPGVDWTDLLRRKDIEAGRRVGLYRNHDLALMLRAMTERLGNLGFPFSRDLPRQAQNYAGELRDVRNRWAHNEPFTATEAYRAVDTAELLLRAVGADQQAEQIKELKPAPAPRRHLFPGPSGDDLRDIRFGPTSWHQQLSLAMVRIYDGCRGRGPLPLSEPTVDDPKGDTHRDREPRRGAGSSSYVRGTREQVRVVLRSRLGSSERRVACGAAQEVAFKRPEKPPAPNEARPLPRCSRSTRISVGCQRMRCGPLSVPNAMMCAPLTHPEDRQCL